MTLALHGKSRKRQGGLLLAALLALIAATLGGVALFGGTPATAKGIQFAAHTSIENITLTATCPNGGSNGVDCNIYAQKTQVFLDGGPANDFLPDAFYCFSVYNSSQATLLSSDLASARVFTVSGGVISSYTGGHPTGLDTRGTPTETTIALAPFNDSTNGEYKLVIDQYATAPTTSGNGCPTGADVEKTDNFKVGTVVLNGNIVVKKVGNFSAGLVAAGFSGPVTGPSSFSTTWTADVAGSDSISVAPGTGYGVSEDTTGFPLTVTGGTVNGATYAVLTGTATDCSSTGVTFSSTAPASITE